MSPAMVMDAGLGWLDLVIHREILRLRARYQLSLDELRGLYVSDEHVDLLVRDSFAEPAEPGKLDEAVQRAQDRYVAALEAPSPLALLAERFELSAWERDILFIALAPELAAKYETLYAYLNNDVTKKAPTLSLMTRLLARERTDALQVRAALMPDSRLLRHGLLRHAAGSDRHATLNAALSIQRGLPSFVLGLGFHDGHEALELVGRERIEADDDWGVNLNALVARACAGKGHDASSIWLVHGRDRALRKDTVRQLARALSLDLLILDCEQLARPLEELAAVLRDALLRQRLERAVLHVTGLAYWSNAEGRLPRELASAFTALRQAAAPVCVDCESPKLVSGVLDPSRLLQLAVPDLGRAERVTVWQRALAVHDLSPSPEAVGAVAGMFTLTIEQIQRAARTLAQGDAITDGVGSPPSPLSMAARSSSDPALGEVAQRMRQSFSLKDLVLAPSSLRRLDDIVRAIRDRQLVFGDWGLARVAGGSGLRVLLAGASGTGKTMAAGAIARECGVDIYRVDIAQTVSKYIGETEKNLDKVFSAAASSNAILFFDEADALFGKRSEVKDAHDRYSNIETAYLLQRLEDYEGVAFMATNLSRNMDTAFSRRLNFVVDFPMPDRQDRERLWRTMLGGSAPLADDVDFDFLAAQFTLTGGEIRNVVLDGAFLAAQDHGQRIGMKHLVIALGRQLVKQGRVPSLVEFKQHHATLLNEGVREQESA